VRLDAACTYTITRRQYDDPLVRALLLPVRTARTGYDK